MHMVKKDRREDCVLNRRENVNRELTLCKKWSKLT